MRIDENKLKTLYLANIESKKPISRRGCPSPKKFMKMLKSKSSEKETTKIVDHLSNCGDCAREFKFLLEVIRNENALVHDIGKLLSTEDSTEGQKKEAKRILDSFTGRRPLFSQISRSSAFFIASFIIIVIAVSMLIIFRTPEKYRAESLSKIKLLHPVNENLSFSSLLFKWEKIKNTEYYNLKLFDKVLSPLWESEKILKNNIILPEEAAKKLEVGSSYFWMITAHISNGEGIPSSLEEFSIKK